MKKLIVFGLPLLLLVSCKQPSPKDTARQFVKASYLLDFETAASLSTNDTKKAVNSEKVNIQTDNMVERNSGFVSNDFMLDSLREEINGNAATVESNGIRLNMVKENNEWKVLASEKLLDDIVNRKEKTEALRSKWNLLYTNYSNRNKVIKEYVEYQAGRGSLNAEGQSLLQLIANTTLPNNFNKSELQLFLDNQKEIGRLADKVIVPSFSANADMNVDLVIRINEAQRNVDAAKMDYNDAALAMAHPLYVLAN